RSAAQAPSMAAPGVRAAPPTTTTWPREYLPAPADGSSQPRSRSGVTTISSGLDITVSSVGRDRGVAAVEVGDVGEGVEGPPRVAVGAGEPCDGGVGDGVRPGELEQVGLAQAGADVEEEHDDG